MIHQNHLPLDQRRERARWKSWCVSGSRRTIVYFSCPRSSPAIEAARPCTTKRSAVILRPACERILGFKRRHRRDYRDSITRPISTLCPPIPTPYLCTPFSLKSGPFPYRKVRSTKGVVSVRCGSMREKINSKLNCHDQYFVSLLLEQRLTKDRAIPSVPSIRCSGG